MNIVLLLGFLCVVCEATTGMRFSASPTIIFAAGKKPKIKNVKFLTNGPTTCRDIECRLLDLESMQNPLYFVHFYMSSVRNPGKLIVLGDIFACL